MISPDTGSRLTAHLELLARMAAVIGAVAIVVISVVPGSERPHTGYSGNSEHFAAYFLVAGALGTGFVWSRYLPGMIALSLWAAIAEIGQAWIPGRSSGIDNWAASSIGAVAGMVGAAILITALRRLTARPVTP